MKLTKENLKDLKENKMIKVLFDSESMRPIIKKDSTCTFGPVSLWNILLEDDVVLYKIRDEYDVHMIKTVIGDELQLCDGKNKDTIEIDRQFVIGVLVSTS